MMTGSTSELNEQLERVCAERDALQQLVITFCGPWAAMWAMEHDLPPGHLHPTHYDILASCGARMDDLTRADIDVPLDLGDS